MQDKFNNKYRIKSTRLPGWDYGADGTFFVTINTKDRVPWFGHIADGKMRLSDMGDVIAEEWIKTGNLRKNIHLDAWVVMPDHFHGIMFIDNGIVPVETQRAASLRGQRAASLRGAASLRRRWGQHEQTMVQKSKMPSLLKPGSLPVIIRAFKSAVTKRIHEMGGPDFAWQPRYYDRIIRDEQEMHNIREYIKNNPMKGRMDNEISNV